VSPARRAEIARLVGQPLMTSERAFALLTACRQLLALDGDEPSEPPSRPPPAVHPDQLPLL
jgi:hypothetical protein